VLFINLGGATGGRALPKTEVNCVGQINS